MEHKRTLVTGATSGIGLATARALARQKVPLVITGRDAATAEALARELHQESGSPVDAVGLNLANLAEVRRAAAEIRRRFPDLAVVVHNAGTSVFTRQTTVDGFETNFAVNHLGPFVLTEELVPLLKENAPARIVVVASSAVAPLVFDDIQSERSFDPMTVYSRSKAANILFSFELARRLAGTGVTVNCLHPGVVRTRLVRDARGLFKVFFGLMGRFFLKPEDGCRTSVFLATSPEVEGLTGGYYDKQVRVDAPGFLNDPATQAELWRRSEQMVHTSGQEAGHEREVRPVQRVL